MSKQGTNFTEDAFTFIDRIEKKYPQLINFSIGNPDGDPHPLLLKELNQAITQKGVHGYGCFSEETVTELRANFSKFYKKRFFVDLAPQSEITEVHGTKTAIFQLLHLLIKENDRVLIPSPSYTVYNTCVQLLNGKIIPFPCEENTFYPDLETLTAEQLTAAKVLILCSPGNPTSTVLSKAYLEKAVALAKKYKFKIIHDMAYAELHLIDKKPLSILSITGSKEVAVELYSLSKSCNIAGWRIGFVCGNAEIISELKDHQFHTEFGLFIPFQKVACFALAHMEELAEREIIKYRNRMTYFIDEMNKLGWKMKLPEASFFIWAKIPERFNSMSDLAFVLYVAENAGVLFTPGSGFGSEGSGYVRIAMVQSMEKIYQAVKQLKPLFI